MEDLLQKGFRTERVLKRDVEIDVIGVLAGLELYWLMLRRPPREVLNRSDLEPRIAVSYAAVKHVEQRRFVFTRDVVEVIQEDVDPRALHLLEASDELLQPWNEPRDILKSGVV